MRDQQDPLPARKNQLKPDFAFPSVKEWNESEYGMIDSGLTEFVDISLFGSVSANASPLLAAVNRPGLTCCFIGTSSSTKRRRPPSSSHGIRWSSASDCSGGYWFTSFSTSR
jgi:hypothetical protein